MFAPLSRFFVNVNFLTTFCTAPTCARLHVQSIYQPGGEYITGNWLPLQINNQTGAAAKPRETVNSGPRSEHGPAQPWISRLSVFLAAATSSTWRSHKNGRTHPTLGSRVFRSPDLLTWPPHPKRKCAIIREERGSTAGFKSGNWILYLKWDLKSI